MRLPLRATVYVVLLLIGIPWFWPSRDTTVAAGLPLWVWIAVLTGLVAAAFTAWCLSQPDE